VGFRHERIITLAFSPEVEVGRAHEITHILDDDEVELGKRQRSDRTLDQSLSRWHAPPC